MTDTALFDVPCPMCGADPLAPCTNSTGEPMWETVHFPRRYASGVPPIPETYTPRERTSNTSKRAPAERTHCTKGLHPWTPENVFTTTDGRHRCRPCRNNRQSNRAQTAKPRTPRQPITHCTHGHEYTDENTYRGPNGGHRRCITCKKTNREAAYAKTKK